MFSGKRMDSNLDEERYRNELREHFMGQVKNSKFQKYCAPPMTDSSNSTSHSRNSSWRVIPKYKAAPESQKRDQQPIVSAGGDASCLLHENNFGVKAAEESLRRKQTEENFNPCQMYPKPSKMGIFAHASPEMQKYSNGPERFVHEMESKSRSFIDGSDESIKTQKTSNTVVSRRSSQELLKMVKSKCKLHEEIDKTLKQISQAIDIGGGNTGNNVPVMEKAETPLVESPLKVAMSNIKEQDTLTDSIQCSRKASTESLEKEASAEIPREDADAIINDSGNADVLTISVDDIVHSKVINPMIRKVQKMYLNNLRDEMSLMEDLEGLSQKVNEVYKATLFKKD